MRLSTPHVRALRFMMIIFHFFIAMMPPYLRVDACFAPAAFRQTLLLRCFVFDAAHDTDAARLMMPSLFAADTFFRHAYSFAFAAEIFYLLRRCF